MKRKQNIEDAFHSVVPELTAGAWSVGYSGHTDNSSFLTLSEFKVTGIRNVTDKVVPGTTNVIMNDVYVDYSFLSGSTTVTGTSSIYTYPVPTTTTTTTIPVITTTTTTL